MVAVEPGQVVLCENVRFNKGEKKDREDLARKMASLCDVFVMDGLGVRCIVVDPLDDANNRYPQPLTALGRFSHEAACIDPDSGTVVVQEWNSRSGSARLIAIDREGGQKHLDAGAAKVLISAPATGAEYAAVGALVYYHPDAGAAPRSPRSFAI